MLIASYEAKKAELQERLKVVEPLAGIDPESAVDRLAEKCEIHQGDRYIDNRNAYLNGFRDGAAAGLNQAPSRPTSPPCKYCGGTG